ncbi:SWIM zinc finger family protein [Streptomyces zaehneri]|uniref:SWIM zinc finger family protein n=1 Tax=Streptomyces zaehneri TaxID=3051180 RepID=UPI0028D33F93|nr:SWIM zinc finger family protein [Streptomyces sp. DSM 40713]
MGETEKPDTTADTAAAAPAGEERDEGAGPAGEERDKGAGPADEARRALRAARERSLEQQPTQAPRRPSQAPPPGPTRAPSHDSTVRAGTPAPRPGDAARAALRRAVESAPAVEPAPVVEPASVGEPVPVGDAARAVLRRTAEPASVLEPAPVGEPVPAGDAARAVLRRTAEPASAVQPSAAADPETPADPETLAAPVTLADTEPVADPVTVADSPPGEAAPAADGDPVAPPTPPEGASPADASPEAAGPRAPQAGAGSRPGDIAREALRAARAEARRNPAETGTRAGRRTPRGDVGPRPRPDARPTEARRHPGASDQVADERARAVRELLAGAFQMPSDDSAEAEPGARPEPAPRTRLEPWAEPEPEPGTGPWAEPEAAIGNATTAEGSSPAAAVSVSPPGGAPSPRPEPPRTPRSMAAPARDGEHRRTFPAFPPRTGGDFAGTWWGNAWVAALEEGALDAKRLARGRGYAEQGNVDAITVTPGLVLAYVQGSRPRPYRVQVRLRTLGAEDWERFLEAAVESPGHIAALLDKEMPESLAECGVPLLPGPGDLEPQCSCPDRGHPCKHAAALCYQTARLLDADPFVLLLLRGRGEREVLDALSRRNATRAARAAQEQEPEPLPGVRAAEALAERRLPPLPAPLPVPPHPEQPPAYPSAPNGPDSFALDHLATDAAARAHALLVTGRDEIGELTLWRDAVRLAASRPGSGLTVTTRALYAALASAVGRTSVELARAVAAWRQGGPDGLTVLEETWDPPAGRFDRARPLLLAADLPAFRPRRNHLTHPRGHVQLRFGRDGLWYAYESEPGHDDWWPRGTPDPDPVGALTGLGGSDEL